MRKVSSAFWPKFSPSSNPKVRVNRTGIATSSPAAILSRNSSRKSFFANVQTAMAVLSSQCVSSVTQGATGQVEEDSFQVGLTGFDMEQNRLRLVEHADQPDQR